VPLRLALLIAVGAGCRATPVAICEWPANHFSGSQAVLLAEVRLAEDIAIRYADGGGYQAGWRERRESCEATLFASLAQARNVGIAQVGLYASNSIFEDSIGS
jgi:hypothetical protein